MGFRLWAGPALLRVMPAVRRGFTVLWLTQGVSALGSEVSLLAFAVLAVVALDASPAALGVLSGCGLLPWLLALPIAARVEAASPRRVLVTAELVRAAAVTAVPVAALLGRLSLPVLCGAALLSGVGQVMFETAWACGLPQLVGRDRLLSAHGRLATAGAVAGIAGPAVGGILVRLVGATGAVLLDTLSFVLSAVAMARTMPTARTTDAVSERWWPAMSAGVVALWRLPLLRSLCGHAMVSNLVAGATGVLFTVYAVRLAGLDATGLGLALAAAGAGAVIGSILAPWYGRTRGTGTAYAGAAALTATAPLLFTAGALGLTTPGGTVAGTGLLLACTGQLLLGAGLASWQVVLTGLRQSATPDRLLARTTAGFRMLSYGTIPAGSLAGGVLGTVAGVPLALAVATAAACGVAVLVARSPVRRIASLSRAADHQSGACPARQAGPPPLDAVGH